MVKQASADMNRESPRYLDALEISQWLAKKKSVATQNAYFSHLKAYFTFLVRHRFREDNPMDLLDSPRRKVGIPRPIHRRELMKVLEYVHLSEVTRERILIAAYSGLRVHEIAKIQGRDVDLEGQKILVGGKGGRVDVLPLHAVVIDIASRYNTRGYWYPSPVSPGKHVSGRSITAAISNAFAQVGVHATAHQLRHFYATELLASGVDIRVVQTLMRHENLSTTAIYAKVSEEQQREAIAKLRGPQLSLGDV